MAKKFLLLSLCFYVVTASAQDKVYSNFIDTVSSPSKEIFQLWRNYVNNKVGSEKASVYWDETEVKKFKAYDLLLKWGCGGPYSTTSHVLKIKKDNDSTYELKVAMSFQDSSNTIIQSVLKFIVKKETGIYKLSNYLPYYTKKWKHYTTGLLTFYYPANYPINIADAKKSEAFLKKVFKEFSLTPYSISFYVASGFAEIEEAAGYEDFIRDGINNTGACFDKKNHLIFSAEGVYHPHELIHVINASFPKAYPWFLAGYAGLVGGHFGKPLSYHQKRVLDYLLQHPDSVKDILQFYYLDPNTNPQYVIGGLFCEEAIRSGGFDKLKKLFSYGTRDEDFYTAIEKEFGISKDKVIPFIIEQLKDPKLFAKNGIDTYNITSGNPDTSLAIFLWRTDTLNPDFSNHREEFIRWDLEHKKISALIKKLFKTDSIFQEKNRIIETNRNGYVLYARQTLLEDYRVYHSVKDEMEFDFLLKRKDSLVAPLIKIMLTDKQVDMVEKKYLKKILDSYFYSKLTKQNSY